MTLCYYLAGLGGSVLSAPSSGSIYWGSVYAATTTPLSTLGLASDGMTPLAPCGVSVIPSGLYPDYYSSALRNFIVSLEGESIQVVPYPWDWRHTVLSIGSSLADVIQSSVSADEPCSIVAHSAGGLVARAAWLALGQVGATALVRRIVTYGTPHQGSYGTVRLWSLDDVTLAQLSYLSVIRAGLSIALPPNSCDTVRPLGIAAVTTTWPALYDVLPLLGGSEAATDPDRSLLFTSSNWVGSVTPSQTWMSYALSRTQEWLNDPASVPPSWVLTTIAGSGVPTAGRLVLPATIGLPISYSVDADGDGTVSVGSALVEGSMQYLLSALHNDLPLLVSSNGLLARAVLEVRTPPTPPPPPVTVPGPIVPLLGGPPITALGYPAGGQSPMRGC